ncbi:1,4-dihydroxy-2-naphthoate octaprenyltransferase [Bacteroidia bacterium]|nr:1,4-dihydroxy-2-naphthoate octaprenyltransferase [Bacteroidia bacterium]GHV44369.1 1,4-dihydroxy-2-naphthoate octaprenyltransferase [Bacteroidia bacterium]
MLTTIKFWFWNTRPHALPQSVLPAVVAFCLAIKIDGFSWWLGVLAVVGVAFAHSSLNLFDDYFDYRVKKSDFRERLAHRGIRARIHKCPYLVSGQATVNQLFMACLVIGGIAALFGVVILYFRGITVLYIAASALVLGVEYSGAPLRLSYRGLGEVVIGLMFGPLSMLGVYFSACGHLDWNTLFVSVPIGLLVANIIYVHSIMDCEPDREVGKMTFAGLLKSKTAMLVALAVLLVLAFGLLVLGVASGKLSFWYLLTLLTLPMAAYLFFLMVQFVKNPEKQFEPHWWIGPVGNFEGMKQGGIGWFMIRWLTARNLLSFFCLLIILAVLIF